MWRILGVVMLVVIVVAIGVCGELWIATNGASVIGRSMADTCDTPAALQAKYRSIMSGEGKGPFSKKWMRSILLDPLEGERGEAEFVLGGMEVVGKIRQLSLGMGFPDPCTTASKAQ